MRAAGLALAPALFALALGAAAPPPAHAAPTQVGPGYDIEMSRMLPMRDGVRLANSPWYQKNYNTGGRIGYEDPKKARVAHIALFHDASRASALLLPLASTTR